jgi:aconitate decarboxylase
MGAECALLAEAGFTGNEDILETQGGYNSVFFKGGLNLDLLLQDFGDPYRMVDPGLNVKKYPAQYFTHWTIDATLDVRRKNNIMPEDIEHVEVEVGADNMAADRWPKTGLDGKFSIPYTVSAALLDGKVVIDTFRDERRFAPDMEAMLDRISFVKNPNIIAQDFAKAWSRVTVQTKDGKSYSSRVDRPLGIWDNPLPWQGRLDKFHDCASRVLLERQANEVVGLIERFETLDSVQPLMDLLRVPTAASK